MANAKFVVVRVTASNLAGSVTRTSASTTVVKQTPTNVVEPTISTNVAVVGNALTGAKGDWAGTPTIAYANSWYACSNQVPEARTTISGGCTAITGATSAIFTPTLAQERKFLVFGVSATNGTATKTYFSASTDAVASRPVYQSGATATPRAGTASSNGSPRVGGIVDATIGTWAAFRRPGIPTSGSLAHFRGLQLHKPSAMIVLT